MPGTPKPVIDPRFGTAWTPIIQNAQTQKQQAAALNSGAQSTNILDAYGNAVFLLGQLNQVVTEGATFGQAGVLVGTGFPKSGSDPRVNPNAGIIGRKDIFWGTATITAGSTSCAFAADGASPVLSLSDSGSTTQIGAANVSDPSTGTATPAIAPGTYVNTISGTSPNFTLTLSQNAQETGSGLYCVICMWSPVALI